MWYDKVSGDDYHETLQKPANLCHPGLNEFDNDDYVDDPDDKDDDDGDNLLSHSLQSDFLLGRRPANHTLCCQSELWKGF